MPKSNFDRWSELVRKIDFTVDPRLEGEELEDAREMVRIATKNPGNMATLLMLADYAVALGPEILMKMLRHGIGIAYREGLYEGDVTPEGFDSLMRLMQAIEKSMSVPPDTGSDLPLLPLKKEQVH